MTVSLPLVFVLGVRTWIVVLIALFGFWLSHTFMAPAIEPGTRSGVDLINGSHA